MIALTFDIDWVPDKVLDDTIEIVSKYNVKATFFATHKTSVLDGLNDKIFEIGIHPNFHPVLNGSLENYMKSIDTLLSWFPLSKGVRSHNLFQATPILSYFVKVGLLYDCNLFLPYHRNLKPFYNWNGLIRIPYFWEDAAHYVYGKPYQLDQIPIDKDSCNILSFHPIHIYVNTDSEARYQTIKPDYQNPKKLLGFRNTKNRGTRDLLIELLEYIKLNNIQTKTLREISEDLLNNIKK